MNIEQFTSKGVEVTFGNGTYTSTSNGNDNTNLTRTDTSTSKSNTTSNGNGIHTVTEKTNNDCGTFDKFYDVKRDAKCAIQDLKTNGSSFYQLRDNNEQNSCQTLAKQINIVSNENLINNVGQCGKVCVFSKNAKLQCPPMYSGTFKNISMNDSNPKYTQS
jgi:hypothetical protein